MDIKNLLKQKEELKDIWDYLGIEAPFPDKDMRLWLLDFSKEMIESAFKVLAEKEHKVDEPVKYLARVLRNAKEQSMTPEERDAQISVMRSVVGKVGAAKRHAKEIAYIKQEFAQVCNDLPPVCSSLAGDTDTGSGVGSGSVFVSLSGTGSGAVTGSTSKPAAAAPPAASTAKEKNVKATPKPKPYFKTCKVCKGVLRRNVNHNCPPPPTCMECGFTGWQEHDCPPDDAYQEKTTPKTKAASAAWARACFGEEEA